MDGSDEMMESRGWKACFGYMDVMARRRPVSEEEASSLLGGISEDEENSWPEGFAYPRTDRTGESGTESVQGERNPPSGAAMIIPKSNASECLVCRHFERCGTFTEMSRKYSGGHVAKLARAASEILDRNRDSMLFRWLK